MTEQRRGTADVSALTTQNLNWEGRILIQLTLAPTSVSSPTIPPPIHVLVPRNTFLHVGLQSAVERLHPFAPISPNFASQGGLVLQISEPDPGADSKNAEEGNSEDSEGVSSPSNINQKPKKFVYPVCWFEDEETRMALRWQFFVGVLFDMKSSSSCSLPWRIKLHFNNYPSSQILPLESPNLLTHVQASFKHSLKQAMTVASGNSKSAMNVTKESHGLLWDAVSTGNSSLFQRVDLISTQKQPMQAIPIRVLVNATNPPIQRRINGVKQSMSLGRILQEWLPEHFVAVSGTDSTSDDAETADVQANQNAVRFWRVSVLLSSRSIFVHCCDDSMKILVGLAFVLAWMAAVVLVSLSFWPTTARYCTRRCRCKSSRDCCQGFQKMQRTLDLAIVLNLLNWPRCSGHLVKWMAAAAFVPARTGSLPVFRRSSHPMAKVLSRFSLSSSHHVLNEGNDSIHVYKGPIFCPSYDFGLPHEMSAVLELAELGIDIAVGPSMIAPGQMGLYGRCSDGIESVTLPECTLLCGYSKSGSFRSSDVGDKTVGFSLSASTTAVFFNRQLMEVQDALAKAATEYGGGSCGLAGHELSMSGTGSDENLILLPIESGFNRYFCPEDIHHDDGSSSISVQNFGQYCNDLAWNQLDPPSSLEDYMKRSSELNCVQLVWRLEYDADSHCLVPTWPVSVLSRDIKFENQQFMELGTRYGWNYWQATVQIDDIENM